jgi:hypothetical protein
MSVTRSFYVAGVRFNPTSNIPEMGDRVLMKGEVWHGERCYAIYTEGGQHIGYLPRQLIPVFGDLADRDWRLVSVNLTAIPWKQYKIRLVS